MYQGLTALDFEKLKIENIKSQTELEEQNHKHLELKLLTGNTLHALNSRKVRCSSDHQDKDISANIFNAALCRNTVGESRGVSIIFQKSVILKANVLDHFM